MTTPSKRIGGLALACVVGLAAVAGAQEPAAPQPVSAAQLKAAIDKPGNLDYETRTEASRTVCRTTAAQAVPALMQTVSDHPDGYVRYRALVLLTGFNDPRTKDSMREVLTSPNDRLRAAAYRFFERSSDPALVPQFLAALDKEVGEFVRPALVRALAAYADDALTAVAKLDGPLQDDAALALGKVGDKRAIETMGELQRTASRQTQPSIAAAICLLGINCESHQNFLADSLKFAEKTLGFQELLRAAAAGLAALGVAGHQEA